jgi:hypothetical protein
MRMQLKSDENLRQALALATCTLLSGAAQAQPTTDWRVDSSILFYQEEDRVSVVEPTIFTTRQFPDEESITLRTVYDSLTGASPNGAITTTTPQTFTGASGSGSYTTPANELPTRSFSDTRIAVGIDWDKRVEPLVRRTLSGNVSKEEDYFSLGGNAAYAWDLNRKLTTITAGVGVAIDRVQPHGGAPTGLQLLSGVSQVEIRVDEDEHEEEREGDDDEDDGERKFVADAIIGVTQVLSRRTLVQFNLSHSHMDGYLTDPYKLVSLVDPASGATLDYVHEKRPKTRDANIAYTKLVHHFDRDVTHLSYRYFLDDWGVRSHTAELEYRYKPGSSIYIEPQLRYYTQTAADFFRHSLTPDQQVDFASADLRLAEMESTTVGIKLGVTMQSGEVSIRAAKMRQTGESHPGDAIGVQRQVDLFPALDATMVNVSYSKQW